jgi:DNA-binding NarL/FixJ family response regulator
MKSTVRKDKKLCVVLIETDPVRFVGFRTLLDKCRDIEITPCSVADIATKESVDLVLLGNDRNRDCAEVLTELKVIRPDLRILVVGNGIDDKTSLKILTCGAKGYLNESSPADEFARAIRLVHEGHVWAPRRVLAEFVDRTQARRTSTKLSNRGTLTAREKQVLEMLVTGCSNKEIGTSLGIEVRTVKAHIAKMMRKVGVANRVALSVHAVTHSLIRQIPQRAD